MSTSETNQLKLVEDGRMCENLIKVISKDSECFGCHYASQDGNPTDACKTIDCDDDDHYYHFVNKIEKDNVELTKEAQRLRKDLRV